MLRAVLDTNVVLAARRATHPQSPNVEILARWQAGEFIWLVTDDIINEYIEKLLKMGKSAEEVEAFIEDVILLAEEVLIRFFHLRHYPSDSDDIVFVLCALNGGATHLVTYDLPLHHAAVFYPEFDMCEPLDFLACLRG